MNENSTLDVLEHLVTEQIAIVRNQLVKLEAEVATNEILEPAIEALSKVYGMANLCQRKELTDLALFLKGLLDSLLGKNQQLSTVFLNGINQLVVVILEISKLKAEDLSEWLVKNHEQMDQIRLAKEAITQLSQLELSDESSIKAQVESITPQTSSQDDDDDDDVENIEKDSNTELKDDLDAGSRPAPKMDYLATGQDSSMFDLFRMEAESQIELINEALISLEEEPTSMKDLDILMRSCHSIKGAARIVGLNASVNLAHVLEDCFEAAKNKKITILSEQVDILLKAVDFVSIMSQLESEELSSWLEEHENELISTYYSVGSILDSRLINVGQKYEEPAEELTNNNNSESTIQTVDSTNDKVEKISETPSKDNIIVASNTPKELTKTTNQVSVKTTNSEIQKKEPERIVRVNRDILNKVLGLASETLVNANWLEPFINSLNLLKTQSIDLNKTIEELQELRSKFKSDPSYDSILTKLQARNKECVNTLSDRIGDIEQYSRRNYTLTEKLYNTVVSTNMAPFNEGMQGFPRMIRDLARQLDKQVNFVIEGKTTPVDRDILKKLEAPLTHILRNALDHGLEMPAERRELGKPEHGTIKVNAFHRGGMLSVVITDDGKGINPEKLKAKAIEKGLITEEVAQLLSENESIELLFLPGFSTAAQVTEISGRGVGLDIAKTMAQEVGGTIRAFSVLGEGTTFKFQLPLTLSVIRTLLVEISGEVYAFPLTRIEQIVMIDYEDIQIAEGRQYFTVNNKNVGLIPAHQVLGFPSAPIKSDYLPVVIINDNSSSYGVLVERFLGEKNLVVRPLDSRFGKVDDVSALALDDDGSLILIIDVSDLVNSINRMLDIRNNLKVDLIGSQYKVDNQKSLKSAKKILVVDDSIAVREMEKKLLENEGFTVHTSVDGIEGWNTLLADKYDMVITDIDMPNMNGIELIEKIRSHSQYSTIPIVVVSYRDRQEDKVRGLEAGANYYLTKSSFEDNTLIQATLDLIGA
jgi:two-component system sensor histidine kinase and response regulator WspE